MAMGSRIFPHLALVNGRKTVKVKGPTGDWDPYAESATFAVIVGQVNRQTGAIVLAKGRSTETYSPADQWWDADADVFDPRPASSCRAWPWPGASRPSKMKDGRNETFEWSVTTRLIEDPPLP